jgi:molybdopterin/thiamine biosynthesis adenylyltransferase/molybdopterin synthase catalytic subunit
LFSISDTPLTTEELNLSLSNDSAGALVVFEGRVRDHNEGKKVKSLEYQVYRELALKEGAKILSEAMQKFNLHGVSAVHREGHLALGECAIWIGATASHRDDAFKATRFVIDEIKQRLPVWKKEHYITEEAKWVFCRDHLHHVHFSEADYYSKQAKLVDQNKLKNSKVLVVGAGGLGCPVLINLASAGVGSITIIDPDTISISNIHRQTLFSPNLVGERKAVVAAAKIQELNPFIHVEAVVSRVKLEHIKHDLVIDCTDNLDTKYFLHDVSHKLNIPLVSASIYKNEGQLRTFVPGNGCLRCLSSVTPEDSAIGNCNDFGVLGVTTSILGSLQASEAIKLISTGDNSTIHHTLFMNLSDLSQMKIKNFKNTDCQVCKGQVELNENDLEVEGGMEILDIRNLTDEEVFAMKPKNVALCCHKGVRSKKLALDLRSHGHEVYSLKGGACSL